MMLLSPRYTVTLCGGCYGGPDAPEISRHRSLLQAVRSARRSDRYQVIIGEYGPVIWSPPRRRSPYGEGLYGTGPQPGEPPIWASVQAARRAETRLQGRP